MKCGRSCTQPRRGQVIFFCLIVRLTTCLSNRCAVPYNSCTGVVYKPVKNFASFTGIESSLWKRRLMQHFDWLFKYSQRACKKINSDVLNGIRQVLCLVNAKNSYNHPKGAHKAVCRYACARLLNLMPRIHLQIWGCTIIKSGSSRKQRTQLMFWP